jgi:imidazolonepropionase-like amidohydrolase
MRLLMNGRLWLLGVACVVSAAACTPAGGATQQAGQETAARTATLFEGARVIVGDGATTIENAAFLVQGNRITGIGRSGEVQAPAGATRVDLTGKTVMPALVDLHSHIGYEDTAANTEDEENFTRENVIDHLERFAYTGHALTHSLGNDNPALFDARYADDPATFTDLRVESRQDSFSGARYYTIGRGLAWEGTGNPRSSAPYPIFKPLQARLAVRELHGQGITFVKLWLEDRGGYQIPGQTGPFYLTQESYSAAITEAHRLGMRTIAHVKTLADTKAMIRAGLDIQTHPIQDYPVDAELLALLKARPNFWVIPVITPAGLGGSASRKAGERPAWLQDPLLRAVKCDAHLERWGQAFEKDKRVPTRTGNLTGENIAALYKSGVRIALGSHDAGGTRPLGWGSHMELEAFVNWVGMSPHQAIVSATSAAATLLGVDDDLGTLAAGKGADFLVLDANPLDDIRNTRRISDVYLRGKKVNREAMAARWRAACGRAVTTSS